MNKEEALEQIKEELPSDKDETPNNQKGGGSDS